MRTALSFPFLFLSGIFAAAHAENPEYRCEPGTVAEDAVAVAYADIDVGVFSDPDNNVCTFAIGGASKSGPASSEEVASIAEILNLVRFGQITPLIVRLTVARSIANDVNRELLDAIIPIFFVQRESLEDCITALETFYSNPPVPIETSEEGAQIYMREENDSVKLGCSVFKPGESKLLKSSFPTLHLYLRSERTTDSLFVPSKAVE